MIKLTYSVEINTMITDLYNWFMDLEDNSVNGIRIIKNV
jgi:hypothetical protein